jgi:hypothetical protein
VTDAHGREPVSVRGTSPQRRLRLFLRDHRILDASAAVPAGRDLAGYMASRNGYMELRDVEWVGTGERSPRLVLRVDAVLWASAGRDAALPLTGRPGSPGDRRVAVEVELRGGYLIAAHLSLVGDQELTAYLQAAPPFVPLRDAELRPRHKALGDVVVNQASIQVIREIGSEPRGPGVGAGGSAGQPDAGPPVPSPEDP